MNRKKKEIKRKLNEERQKTSREYEEAEFKSDQSGFKGFWIYEELPLDGNGKIFEPENGDQVHYKKILYNGETLEGLTKGRYDVLKKYTSLSDALFVEREISIIESKIAEFKEECKTSELKFKAKKSHEEYLKWLNEELQKTEIKTGQENKSSFSVLEWATVFYYADETKLLSGSGLIKTRMEQFINKHGVGTTLKNLKAKYYQAKDRINEKNNYPVNKLEKIIPFLEENYNLAVTKVKNEIIFLKENNTDH